MKSDMPTSATSPTQPAVHKLAPAPAAPRRLRVAAYARVSSGKDSMLHSLSAQVSHYSAYIQNHPGWTYAGVYADADSTGTRADRPEFQRMLEDVRAGRIDRVITKSISRFARNTVSLLEIVRELKGLGVGVYFTQENIDSLSGGGELALTIYAALAQAESRSVSDNCKWRVRKDFSEGKPMNLMLLYGYRSRGRGIEIDEKEAAIVRRVFRDYLNGKGMAAIAEELRTEGVPCRVGGEWTKCKIGEIRLKTHRVFKSAKGRPPTAESAIQARRRSKTKSTPATRCCKRPMYWIT